MRKPGILAHILPFRRINRCVLVVSWNHYAHRLFAALLCLIAQTTQRQSYKVPLKTIACLIRPCSLLVKQIFLCQMSQSRALQWAVSTRCRLDPEKRQLVYYQSDAPSIKPCRLNWTLNHFASGAKFSPHTAGDYCFPPMTFVESGRLNSNGSTGRLSKRIS